MPVLICTVLSCAVSREPLNLVPAQLSDSKVYSIESFDQCKLFRDTIRAAIAIPGNSSVYVIETRNQKNGSAFQINLRFDYYLVIDDQFVVYKEASPLSIFLQDTHLT